VSKNRLTALVTGELAGSRALCINATLSAEQLEKRHLLPFGYTKEVHWSDGSISDGVLKPVPIWYVETPDARILVDTGFHSAEGITAMRSRHGMASYMRRKPEWEVPAALASIGVQPEDIDIVVLTHLHYDHCGCNHLFKRARFCAHQKEVPLALAPPPYAQHYLSDHSSHVIEILDRLHVLQDVEEIVPGVWTWRAGGHTPGSIVVMVESNKGPVAIMGDLMHDYVNLEHNWPGPSNNYWCIDELVAAYARVKRESRIILPGHDWKLWQIYPGGIVLP
jgi:glyoxylase-like metal-dependent hydrolase (beta-lactamase superfamily II)